MSRYSAVSDMDATDNPWDAPQPCHTRGCENTCDTPGLSAFCYDCRIAEMLRQREVFKRGVKAQLRKKEHAS